MSWKVQENTTETETQVCQICQHCQLWVITQKLECEQNHKTGSGCSESSLESVFLAAIV